MAGSPIKDLPILKNDWVFYWKLLETVETKSAFSTILLLLLLSKNTQRSLEIGFLKKMLDESHLQKCNLFKIKTCVANKGKHVLILENLSKPTITNWNKTYERVYLFQRSSPRDIKRQLKFNPFKRKPIKFLVNITPTWFTAHEPREQITPIGAKPTVLPSKSIPLYWIKKFAIIFSKFIKAWKET